MTDDQHGADPTPRAQLTQPKGIDPNTGEPYEPIEVPALKRSAWDRLLHRAETTSPSRGDSDSDAA